MGILAARIGLASLMTTLAFATATPPARAEPLPGTTCSLFPADSIFNTDISSLPVSAQSTTWLSNMTQNTNLHPDLGTFAQWYGMPINIAPPPTSGVTPTFTFDSESDHPAEGYPIDQSTQIEGGPSAPSGSDRHALVVNSNLCRLYEIYNLQNFSNGQTPQAGSGAMWDLSSDAMRPDGWTSADAAGLPITPLLLRPDEILAGTITHAIRFTTHCTHGYIWPGSHNAGLCDATYPPMGSRFRLRAGFDISHFSATTQVVLRAFQHYGLILADNGSDWFFQGSTDDWWGTTAGSAVVSELKSIPAAQFDAIDESSLQFAPGSYRALGGGWQSLDGVLAPTSGPSMSSSSTTLSDVFVRGTDNQLWQREWSGTTWTGWTPLGGVLISDPSAVSQATNLVDVFVIGTDHGIWHRARNGSAWSAWENSAGAGGYATSSPEVSSWGPGRLDLIVRGTDAQLWHRSWNGTVWSAWDPAGGVATSDPGLVASGSGRIDVFVRGTDNALWHRSGNGAGSWGPWESLGGVLTSAPEAASCSAGHLDAFVLGTGGVLWRRSYNGTAWAAWQKVGGAWTSNPGAACRPGTTTVEMAERGADGALWHTTVTGT
jgi:hypothetical protein